MSSCKYCDRPENKQTSPCLRCDVCESLVHLTCLSVKNVSGNMAGDVFFEYTCIECGNGTERIKRDKMSWLFVLALVLYHLSLKSIGTSNNGFFHWKNHLGLYVTQHWDNFFDTSCKRKKNFSGTFPSILSSWNNVFFESGLNILNENGWWRMANGFSPALVKYLYTEFVQWKQKDRRNASLVTSDKVMEQRVLRNILAQIGFEHLLMEPETHSSEKDEYSNENEESAISSPKSEIRSDISTISYRGDIVNSDVEDYFSNFLNMNNFDNIFMDLDESLEKCSDLNSETSSMMDVDSQSCVYKNSTDVNKFDSVLRNHKAKSVENYIPPPTKGLFSDSIKSSKVLPWKNSECSNKYLKCEPHLITEYEEIKTLNYLNKVCRKAHFVNIDRNLIRLRAKLALRRLKRNRHMSTFNIDETIRRLAYYPPQTDSEHYNYRVLDKFQSSATIALQNNFGIRLISSSEIAPFISPYSGKLLKPYIWRDSKINALWLQVMEELEMKVNKNNPDWIQRARAPLDYCYVRPHHIASINNMCAQYFWPGIDLSDTLLYPEYSCVALYKKIVVGFAFLVPDVSFNETYISFIFTRPEWRKCGIATIMLYHLTQTCVDKDITLHVSASNSAIFLYQKFGFKIEEFLQEFYDKYFPPESKECKHALFLRLNRS